MYNHYYILASYSSSNILEEHALIGLELWNSCETVVLFFYNCETVGKSGVHKCKDPYTALLGWIRCRCHCVFCVQQYNALEEHNRHKF